MRAREIRIGVLPVALALLALSFPVSAQNVGAPLGMSRFDPRPVPGTPAQPGQPQMGQVVPGQQPGQAMTASPQAGQVQGGQAVPGTPRSRVPAMTAEEMAIMTGPQPLPRTANAPGPIMFGPDSSNHGLAFLQASRGRDGAATALAGGRAVRLGVGQIQIRRGGPAYALRIEGNSTCDERGCDTEIHMASGSSWIRIFRDYTSGLEITAYDQTSGMARLEDQNGRRWEWDGRGYALVAQGR